MTDSQYLGTIQVWRNVNEHHSYLTSTKSVIFQINLNCNSLTLLNMLPFHIKLERLKLIYYSLILNFSQYYFNIGTHCLIFLYLRAFTVLEF